MAPKPVAINPLKLSQPAGATLAFMGINGAVPLWHGVQGCTAFAKILFIQHFREPMPFQTTALNHISVVMGGDDQIVEALDNIAADPPVTFIGLHTTGVAETSGVDLAQVVKKYGQKHASPKIVYVVTPDFEGSLETGWVKAVNAIIDQRTAPAAKRDNKLIAILPGPYITPAEIEVVKQWVALFGLTCIFLPDIGDSLNGYVNDASFTGHSIGGTTMEQIESLAGASAILTIGNAMEKTGERLGEKWGISSRHFSSLATMDEIDSLFILLSTVSNVPVPKNMKRQRRQWQDTILDTHFYLSGKRAAIAGDPEFVSRYRAPLEAIGMEVVTIGPIRGKGVDHVGDLADMATLLAARPVDLVVGNTHVAQYAEANNMPIVRAGIPVTDRIGEPQSERIGYAGCGAFYREATNAILAAGRAKTKPYISSLQQEMEQETHRSAS
jgi:nitrogenase molybdenum-iron protein NifN